MKGLIRGVLAPGMPCLRGLGRRRIREVHEPASWGTGIWWQLRAGPAGKF